MRRLHVELYRAREVREFAQFDIEVDDEIANRLDDDVESEVDHFIDDTIIEHGLYDDGNLWMYEERDDWHFGVSDWYWVIDPKKDEDVE